MTRDEFRALVDEALLLIPVNFREAMHNIAIVVEDEPSARALADVGLEPPDTLLGLYEGTALTERDSSYAGSLPDTITIYRDALLDMCETEDEVVDEVTVTVVHEIAHHFGIDDDRLHELGWG